MVPEISTKFPELTELPEITWKFRKEMEFPEFLDIHFRGNYGVLAELSKLLTERIALVSTACLDHCGPTQKW